MVRLLGCVCNTMDWNPFSRIDDFTFSLDIYESVKVKTVCSPSNMQPYDLLTQFCPVSYFSQQGVQDLKIHFKSCFFNLKAVKDILQHFKFVNWWIGEFVVSFFLMSRTGNLFAFFPILLFTWLPLQCFPCVFPTLWQVLVWELSVRQSAATALRAVYR